MFTLLFFAIKPNKTMIFSIYLHDFFGFTLHIIRSLAASLHPSPRQAVSGVRLSNCAPANWRKRNRRLGTSLKYSQNWQIVYSQNWQIDSFFFQIFANFGNIWEYLGIIGISQIIPDFVFFFRECPDVPSALWTHFSVFRHLLCQISGVLKLSLKHLCQPLPNQKKDMFKRQWFNMGH